MAAAPVLDEEFVLELRKNANPDFYQSGRKQPIELHQRRFPVHQQLRG